jgi:hypothetical protein
MILELSVLVANYKGSNGATMDIKIGLLMICENREADGNWLPARGINYHKRKNR